MADLTTLANAKQWMGVSTTDDDALITRLIGAGSGYIQTWLNRTFDIEAYTETRNGQGGDSISVKNYPILSVTSVMVDGIAIPAATSATSSGYIVNDIGTMLYLRGYRFCQGRGNVTLAYSAGFATVPKEIEQACLELVGLRYKEKDRIGIVSKVLAGETVSYTQKDFSEAIKTILNGYKKVVLL